MSKITTPAESSSGISPRLKRALESWLDDLREIDRCDWAIGDAMLLEMGLPKRRYHPGIAEVVEHSSLTPAQLHLRHKVAYAFPPERRRAVSWAFHEAAGTPGVLDMILAEREHTGRVLSLKQVRGIRKILERHPRLVAEIKPHD
jgi:hypothetical protein